MIIKNAKHLITKTFHNAFNAKHKYLHSYFNFLDFNCILFDI